MTEAKKLLKEEAVIVEEWLEKLLPPEDTPPRTIHRAMRYSVFAGGKRLRPVLAILAYRWAGGEGDDIYPPACGLELIHTYSLIHDDLPCMDDDDLRRGKPTSHRVFGEAMAILAGDALHALAFELLAQGGRSDIMGDVAAAIGTEGLVGGQVFDLEGEGREPTPEMVRQIHTGKTAALIAVSLRLGAAMAGAPDSELEAITAFGRKLGLAFQIVDDVLDIVADETELGKPVGSDRKHAKATYPAVYGLERSRELATELTESAVDCLPDGRDSSELRSLADFILKRAY